MALEDGRDRHFLAACVVQWISPAPGRQGNRVQHLLAFGLSPVPADPFPLLIDEHSAQTLQDDFAHPDVVSVLQHADGQRGEEGVAGECAPPWQEVRFGTEATPRLVHAAHLEPWGRGESLLLTCEANGGRLRAPISALRVCVSTSPEPMTTRSKFSRS